VSFNPAEEEMLQVLMAGGGYVNFSEFAKAKILGVASEQENRLKALEIELSNVRQGYERHHRQWVQTVKSVSGADAEPLVAATYALLHMMANPQAQATMDQEIDLKRVKTAIGDKNNGYRRHTHTKDGKDAQNAVYADSSAKQDGFMDSANNPTDSQNDDGRGLSQGGSQKAQLNPYEAGKQKAAAEKWSLFGRQQKQE
jgi:hypothetical protein